MKAKTLLFVGGGTAGHILPLLAVMQEVQQTAPEIECVYVGTEQDMANPVIVNSELKFKKEAIQAGKLHRFATWQQFSQIGRVVEGMAQAKELLNRIQPNAIYSKGGYVSVPIALAAARQKIPLFTHETDVVPGLANRLIARSAQEVFTAFPVKAYRRLPVKKLHYVGQPIRAEFFEQSKGPLVLEKHTYDGSQPLITVIGGSQGARRINQLVQGSWQDLLPRAQIVQLTGQLDYSSLREAAGKLPEPLREKLLLLPFLDHDLANLFAHSTLMVSRAGGTIAELAASKKAVVLIPLSTAAQNHQMANAQVLAKAGAAQVIDEKTISQTDFTAILQRLLEDKAGRMALEKAIAQFAKPEAAKIISQILIKNMK